MESNIRPNVRRPMRNSVLREAEIFGLWEVSRYLSELFAPFVHLSY